MSSRLSVFCARGTLFFVLCVSLLVLVGCSDSDKPTLIEPGSGNTKIILQTDWYPQPEHGGFYYALEHGFYREAGLDVEIRPGANMQGIYHLVATNRVHFAIGTSDNIMTAMSRGLPLVMLFPYFQHDPQCIMFRQSTGITSLADLNGRNVMMNPGMNYVTYIQQTMGIRLNLIPMDYSLARFAADEAFIQQCFVTSEPYPLAQRGIDVEVIPLSDSGFDPYRVVYGNENYIQTHPEVVQAFIAASLRGWQAFMDGNTAQTFARIGALNPQHTTESMQWTVQAMRSHHLTHGKAVAGETLGAVNLGRLARMISQLDELELLEQPLKPETLFALHLLPEALVQKSQEAQPDPGEPIDGT